MSKVRAVMAVLLIAVGLVWGATVEVSHTVAVTSNPKFERNQCVLKDSGGNYWLFYARADNVEVRDPSHNPDTDTYHVYYKKASSIEGLLSATPQVLDDPGPSNLNQRIVSAVEYDGLIWVFVSYNRDKIYYYTTSDGGATWSPVDSLIDTLMTGVADNWSLVADGKLWLFYDGGRSGVKYIRVRNYDGTSWSDPVTIHTGNTTAEIAKAYYDGTYYFAFWTSYDAFSYAYSTDGVTWTERTDVVGTSDYDCDPMMLKMGGRYYLFDAVWEASDRTKLMVFDTDDPINGSWNGPHYVTNGGYGNNIWWDFWPVVLEDDGDYYLFYTSEKNGDELGSGEIYYMTIDWDLLNDHFEAIQPAIDFASDGDVVHVHAGTFEEQLEIAKNITLMGDGIDVTTVLSPDTLGKFFSTTHYNYYPIIYIHDVDNAVVNGLTVDGAGKGNNNYRFSGIAYYNAGGKVEGCKVIDVRNTPIDGSQHGIAIYAYVEETEPVRSLNVYDNTISGFQKNGITLNGNLQVDVRGNYVEGYGPADFIAQNCIQLGYGAVGTVENNTVLNVSYTGTGWTACGILFYGFYDMIGAYARNNTIQDCQTGFAAINVTGSFENNTVTISGAGTGVTDYCGMYVFPYAHDKGRGMKLSPLEDKVWMSAPKNRNTYSFDIIGNEFTGSGDTASYGIGIYSYFEHTVNYTLRENSVTGFAYGIEAWADTAATVNVTARYNCISGNLYYGVYSWGPVVDFCYNYWGSPDGPAGAGPGTGDYVSSYVLYEPWNGVCRGTLAATSLLPYFPDMNTCWTDMIPTLKLIPNAFYFKGAKVTVNFDNSKLDIYDAAGLSDLKGDIWGAGDPFFYWPTSFAGNNTDTVRFDASCLDSLVGGDGSKTIAYVPFKLEAPGESNIVLTGVDIRDDYNVGVPFDVVNATAKFWLGDVASPGDTMHGDGVLDINDLNLFANAYWSHLGDPNYGCKYDIGPTEDGYIFTMPVPDGVIEFEDLMIFAITWGYTNTRGYYAESKVESGVLSYGTGLKAAGNVEEYSFELVGAGGLVGADLLYQYDPRRLHLVSVEKGGLLSGIPNSFLVYEDRDGKLRINVATFGEPLSGTGSLVVLKFAKLTPGDARPVLREVDLRDYRNRQVLNNADRHTLSGEVSPSSFALSGAIPNPMVSFRWEEASPCRPFCRNSPCDFQLLLSH